MTDIKSAFNQLLLSFSGHFTKPSFNNFQAITKGWILTPGRKTMTKIIQSADVLDKKHFTAYLRFFSRAIWSYQGISQILTRLAVKELVKDEKTIYTAGDDTLYAKSGKKIHGAGIFRDAVLSGKKSVTRWGLNFVTSGLTIRPYQASCYLCLPMLAQLHQKGKNTPSEIMNKTLQTFSEWFPDKRIRHAVDGYYSNKEVIGSLPANVDITGRIRCDAVIYEVPKDAAGEPRRRRGRPRKKGRKLPPPRGWADWSEISWQKIKFQAYGEAKEVLVKQKTVLWYRVSQGRPLNVLIVRDAEGKWKDEYFFSTDLQASAELILEDIVRRNAIELMHKDSKQVMGVHHGQSRVEAAIERQIPFGLWLMSLVMIWYLRYGRGSQYDQIPQLSWYKQKSRASFIDMLACLRRSLWEERFLINSTLAPEMQKIIYPLISALTRAG